MKKKKDIRKIIAIGILISFIIPVIFLGYRIFNYSDDLIRTKSDYILMFVQCLLGILAFFLPSIIAKKANIVIPGNMYYVFVLFLYCAIFLGEVRNYYHTVPHWDTILHLFSGGMLGALGFSVINILNKEHLYDLNLSPVFIAFFAFCFALTLGVFWEIYEFSFDGLLDMNMQKFATMDGTLLVGREALVDTMKDLIVDSIGGACVAIIGYFSLKTRKKDFVDKILIEKNKRSL